MSEKACSMAGLVEARRDGRLGDREIASVDRHLGSCAECRALQAELDRITALSRAPAPQRSPLEHQRGRVRLLQAASLLGAEPRESQSITIPFVALGPSDTQGPAIGSARARWKLVAAAGAIAAAGLIGGRALHRAGPPAAVTAAAQIENTVRPAEGARYERSVTGTSEVVSLASGSVEIGVRKLAPSERFVVKTTDGEVEARGTRLRVAADAGRLRSVDVIEGAVEVRYAGAVIVLGTGEAWTAPASPGLPNVGAASGSPNVGAASGSHTPGPAEPALPNVGAASGPHTPGPAEPAHDHDRAGEAAAATDAPPRADASAMGQAKVSAVLGRPRVAISSGRRVDGAAKKDDGSKDFADGVGLIERGDYGAATDRLREFREKHPGDARAEDAAFLAIVALQRAGKREAAAAAARDYLASFPTGYRRAEASAIANR